MHPNITEVERIINIALEEDVGNGDITSNITIAEDSTIDFQLTARESMIVCGIDIASRVFAKISSHIKLESNFKDGDKIKTNDVIIKGHGNTRYVLTAERVALNLLQHLSAIATETNKYVQKISATKAKILDTRKTLPTIRELQKYAVTVGGGTNHRFRLDDAVLIKDNHIAASGGIYQALQKAKQHAPKGMKIEIECDTLEQVKEALTAGAENILLDNMTNEELKKAVDLNNGQAKLEASGNVNLNTVEDIARTGVDFISVGKLTHSVIAVDIGLDILNG